MKAKIKIWILLGLLVFSFTSCDDYLNISDPDKISAGNFPTNLEQVNLLVNSTYGGLHEYSFMGWKWHGMLMQTLDHTVDLAYRDSPALNGAVLGLAVNDAWHSTISTWRSLNTSIYYCNVALNGIEQYRQTVKDAEKQQLDHLEGQVLFLRSFYLWHLQTLHGQPNLDGMGVPVVQKVIADLKELSVPREKTSVVYRAMINDFKQASTLLKGQTDNHRATEWSAKAFLAKSYMYIGQKDSASTVLKDIIDNSGKSLVSFHDYGKMFGGNATYEMNSEAVFEVENNLDVTTRATGAAVMSTSYPVINSLMQVIDGARLSKKGFANTYVHDANLTRFGYNDNPLLMEIENVNAEWQIKQDYVERQYEMRKMESMRNGGVDPRLYINTLQPMIDSAEFHGNWYPVAQQEFGNWWELTAETGLDPTTFYGWPVGKGNLIEGTLADQNYNNDVNFYPVRLADVYLMYAETVKESNPTLALEYINKVHRRAYDYDPNSASPVDYVSLSDRTKTIDPADHLANDPLFYELWAETFAEGKWWETVRRLDWGQLEADYYKTAVAGQKIVWRDEHYAMPIPSLEFEANDNPGMVQNPGY